MGKNNKRSNTQEFTEKSKKIYGNKYDYSDVNYINALTKVNIKCQKHGNFLIKPNSHLSGQGCKWCGVEKRKQNKPKSQEQFIKDCKNIHGENYNYSLAIYVNNETKVKIKCNKCDCIFEQTPGSHLHQKSGCVKCNKNKEKSIYFYKGITKICKKCNKEKKVLNDFYVDNASRNRNLKYIYYRGNCKECEKQLKVEYRKLESSKERSRIYHRIYNRERKKIDLAYKLRKDISTIIKRSIKKNYSGDSIWNYLPYTPSQLKEHLEKQFDQNMNWDNHGPYWHIDHIKPQVMLKYDSISHPNFLECWSLENLRPFKAEDNLKKSSFFDGINYRNK